MRWEKNEKATRSAKQNKKGDKDGENDCLILYGRNLSLLNRGIIEGKENPLEWKK